MTISAVSREQVKYGVTPDLWIEGVLLPEGKIRYAGNAISVFLGKDKTYVLQVVERTKSTLESWQKKGFTGCIVPVRVAERGEGKRGSSIAKTFSGEDLDAIIAAEAERGNLKAQALQNSAFAEVRKNRERDAFGMTALTLEESRQEFSESYAHWEEVLADNREDVMDLELPGDVEYSYVWIDQRQEDEGIWGRLD